MSTLSCFRRRFVPAAGLSALLLLISSAAQAQEWAEKMFNTLEHDFGTVARGADTVFRFELTNLYKQEMNLIGVRSSCGCTSATIENPKIKTHEKAYVVARFNTRTPPHLGRNGATVTVSLGAPYAAEVQLQVHGNIRGDVVFNPGSVDFGETDEGAPAVKKVTVEYAGRSDWEIVDVTNDNDNFEVELNPMLRNGGRVAYELLVRMKPGTPAGYVKDQVTVVTNDLREENQRIPLFVSGHVRPEFSVMPQQLVLGSISTGEQTSKKIIVRGRKPFRIVDVDCGDDCFEAKFDDQVRPVHFVEVTFRAGDAPGKLQTPIRIVTDQGDDRGPTCVASATVVASEKEPELPQPVPATEDDSSDSAAAPSAIQTADNL